MDRKTARKEKKIKRKDERERERGGIAGEHEN